MFHSFVFCWLCFWHLVGVFADPGEVKSVSVTEGDSVTLDSSLTQIKTTDLIIWKFGQREHTIAQINKAAGKFDTYDGPDGRFRDRLKLDHQNGSLTITDTKTTHSGLYQVTNSDITPITHRFNVTVYGSLGSGLMIGLSSAAVAVFLVLLAAVGIFWIYKRHRKTDQADQTRNEDITYADPTFYQRKAKKSEVKQEEEVVYAGVVMKR
ncbi:uncharacterized protein LOC113077647 isoform X1 [Carassius auratus]|uniref:Uncharacterized protein LOC113077647 isoform X1 n=1 Tax=Carassius auratus TaxID=7957 RepID=A0A6P6NB36_CARAU|nr:uncharacterized protein LOC113077647 isoform X1 [Carassius auratus]